MSEKEIGSTDFFSDHFLSKPCYSNELAWHSPCFSHPCPLFESPGLVGKKEAHFERFIAKRAPFI